MYKTILVPIDIAHLEESKNIIDVALEHATPDARIVLFNVIEEIPRWVAAELPADLHEKSVTSAKQKLHEVGAASGREMEVEVRTGHGYNTIMHYAEELQPDLIIVASHRPGMKERLLGSTASRVVRHAACSVLVVR